jgi:hypothetical protein
LKVKIKLDHHPISPPQKIHATILYNFLKLLSIPFILGTFPTFSKFPQISSLVILDFSKIHGVKHAVDGNLNFPPKYWKLQG